MDVWIVSTTRCCHGRNPARAAGIGVRGRMDGNMGKEQTAIERLRVLVACEESQAVCKAFRALGHEAYSCDIQDCSGGHPEWHIKWDALALVNGRCSFTTCDGQTHRIDGTWDLLIAHPPCTYVTASSAVCLFNRDHTVKDPERFERGKAAAAFFLAFLNADCPRIAVENPVPLKCFGLPPYRQIIEPFHHGDPWRKRTCLWLKNLPELRPTDPVEPKGLWVGSTSYRQHPETRQRYELTSNRDSKTRAKTFPGIARAMAEQWG